MRSGVFFSDYQGDMQLRRLPLEKLRLGLFLAALCVFPFFADTYWLTLANQIAIATIGALGLNVLVGYTGQISLGQGAFMAIGAYSSGIFAARFDIPFFLSIPIACLITAAIGVFFGLPSLRLKGLYLAIATLAAQQIVEWVITHWTGLTGGTEALVVPSPRLFGVRLNRDFNFYWISVGLALLVALFVANLFRSRVGRAMVAVRDQDIAASALGVDVFRTKLVAFATSSFLVGLSGALIAHYRGIVTWERFTLETSITYLAMIIIGGLGTVSGSFFGAAFLTLLPALITTVGRDLQTSAPGIAAVLPFVQQGVFGLVVILFLVLEPEGLAKLWRNVKDYFRTWPFSY
ncbi:MAG: branched-chain amino acid ABC transporter permease [Acidobacteria bacterium]|nr:MAG: branched-chain amino acid ABC transporter permease [Acidobacteriota bacterium]REK09686.1 MAG: branched-chain amino acid ABC transporter permease [Acidobacteriota bacterium]